jgi:1A family penicillin-binding protein
MGRAVAAVLVVILAAYGWFVAGLLAGVPTRAELETFREMPAATLLFDANDREVFTLAQEHRIVVPLSRISPTLVRAVIAVEDRRFFDHGGFDPIRIAGSALAVVRAGEAVQGGSTITQQLARQEVGREKTLSRKLRELLFAAQLERHFTKDEILELYLNKVYFGAGLYGVEAAARGYFAKPASALTLPEAALLTGLLKAPSSYQPTERPERAVARRNVVLRAMLEAGAITPAEHEAASAAAVTITDGLRADGVHGHYFKEEVRRWLVQRFGPDRVALGGLRVYTTIDPVMQRAAEAAVAAGLRDIDRTLPKRGRGPDPLQAALVAIDPATGEVRALVGGRDFASSPFNRATQARRQPGSAFKPFIYAAALEDGLGPDDWIEGLDEPVRASGSAWTPDDAHAGAYAVTLREGLRLSSNRAAVQLLNTVGLRQTVRSASAFGFDDLPAVPSLALGSGEVTLASLTAAYGAFVNRGAVLPPTLVRRVEDADGALVFDGTPAAVQAIRPDTAYLMADMLRGVIDAGTGYGARQRGFRLPAGGKTGTTNEYRDAWFVGFTPSIVTGVWIGYDQPRTIRRDGYASELAVPMWTTFMKAATRGHDPEWIPRPRGLVYAGAGAPPEPPGRNRSWWSRVFGFGR